jgi:hypothetical protein
MADKPIARVPKMSCGKISLARDIHCGSNFFLFILLAQRLKKTLMYMCIYTRLTVQTVHKLPLLPNNTAVKYFYTNQSGGKC